MSTNLLAILGGTFDPVHNGHLHIANELLKNYPIEQIVFVPCNIPAIKNQTKTTAADRLNMLKLATCAHQNMHIDDCEIKRGGVSFMHDTLKQLRRDNPDKPLALIMGQDAFDNFNNWHNWQQILTMAHLIIVPRPGYSANTASWAAGLQQQHATQQFADLEQNLYGKIFHAQIAQMPVSSTEIREKCHDLSRLPTEGVNKKVRHYITQHNLYQ